MMRQTFLFLFAALLQFTFGGIVSIDNMKLLPFEFTYNYRFVYSDRKPEVEDNQVQLPLEKAYANFDLKMKPVFHIQSNGTDQQQEYRLFIMMGDKKTLAGIILPLEEAREMGKLNNAKQIEEVIDLHASGLPIYGALTISSKTNDTYKYQKSAKIDK